MKQRTALYENAYLNHIIYSVIGGFIALFKLFTTVCVFVNRRKVKKNYLCNIDLFEKLVLITTTDFSTEGYHGRMNYQIQRNYSDISKFAGM